MNFARYLTEGVGGWLQFEGACGRDGLFSEKYLTVPIGQILSANTKSRVLAEHKHPILSSTRTGPGRRPEIDFVVCENYPQISIAVESKWIGNTKPKASDIVWDLIRLEMMANSGARCFFLLGGKKAAIDGFLESVAIAGTEASPPRPLLRQYSNQILRVPLVPTSAARRKLLRDLFKSYQSFEFPHYIVTRRSAPFPLETTANRYQIYAWEVMSMGNREVFRPENSRAYRQGYSMTNDETE